MMNRSLLFRHSYFCNYISKFTLQAKTLLRRGQCFLISGLSAMTYLIAHLWLSWRKSGDEQNNDQKCCDCAQIRAKLNNNPPTWLPNNSLVNHLSLHFLHNGGESEGPEWEGEEGVHTHIHTTKQEWNKNKLNKKLYSYCSFWLWASLILYFAKFCLSL